MGIPLMGRRLSQGERQMPTEQEELQQLERAEDMLDTVVRSTHNSKHFDQYGWAQSLWWYLLMAYETFTELDLEPQWEVRA